MTADGDVETRVVLCDRRAVMCARSLSPSGAYVSHSMVSGGHCCPCHVGIVVRWNVRSPADGGE